MYTVLLVLESLGKLGLGGCVCPKWG
jgi:hypothetical protein